MQTQPARKALLQPTPRVTLLAKGRKSRISLKFISVKLLMRELKLKGGKRWEVLFREGNWLVGLYCPEHASREQVEVLEKHDFPELFYLVEGDVTLLIGEKCKEVKLTKDKAVVVEDWHNAYGKGKVLVVEREGVKTEFKQLRKTS